jgi:hypothetical protein
LTEPSSSSAVFGSQKQLLVLALCIPGAASSSVLARSLCCSQSRSRGPWVLNKPALPVCLSGASFSQARPIQRDSPGWSEASECSLGGPAVSLPFWRCVIALQGRQSNCIDSFPRRLSSRRTHHVLAAFDIETSSQHRLCPSPTLLAHTAHL